MISRALPTHLGRLGLLFLLPISICYAELTVFVEAPILSRYRSGPHHDFGGPGLGALRMQFTFDESYSDSYDRNYLVSTIYSATFDVLRASATGNGASFNSTSAEASLVGWRLWGSSVWDYNLSFWMIAADPVAANAQGYARFDNFGYPTPDNPFYDTYSFADDPYFGALGAGFSIDYRNISQSPEEFIQSFLSIGLKDESQMTDFYSDVSLRRSPDGGGLTAYQASYSVIDIEENEFRIVVAVPEPSAYGIAGVGLIGIAALIRRRSGRAQ